jgi:N-acetylglucosaminyldiphosphoundecaprenol N-acetyl-beta-D-mannosaminyltransferase
MANGAVLGAIERFDPHLLLVGMGMPRQEKWILDNIEALKVPAIIAVGGCMKFVAGALPPAPRWLGHWGLEWLFLLLASPYRGIRRYLIEPWSIAFRLAKELGMRAAAKSQQR